MDIEEYASYSCLSAVSLPLPLYLLLGRGRQCPLKIS